MVLIFQFLAINQVVKNFISPFWTGKYLYTKGVILFKKLIVVTTILSSSLLLQANSEISYKQPSKITIDKSEAQAYKDIFFHSKTVSYKKMLQKLSQNRVFAKEFLKQDNLTKKERQALNIAIEDAIAKIYIQRYKESHKPSKAAIKSFYLDHQESFQPTQKVTLSSIVTDSLSKADKIYLEVTKNPKKFDAIAKKESLEPLAISFKDVPIERFNPIVREWIRNHKKEDISEPIKVGRFYYIDKLDKKVKTVIDYDHLKEDIKELLLNLYIKNRLENHYESLKEKYEGIGDD